MTEAELPEFIGAVYDQVFADPANGNCAMASRPGEGWQVLIHRDRQAILFLQSPEGWWGAYFLDAASRVTEYRSYTNEDLQDLLSDLRMTRTN